MPSSSGRHQAIGCGLDIASTILEMKGVAVAATEHKTLPNYTTLSLLKETHWCMCSLVHLFIQEAFTVAETYDPSI